MAKTCALCDQPVEKDEELYCINCNILHKCKECGKVCYFDRILCNDCYSEPTLGQKALAIAIITPGAAYFAATELVAKPAIRKARKLLKGLSDWAET